MNDPWPSQPVSFQAKAGVKTKLAQGFLDRDKTVVLGDVEYAGFASVDREQGRMGRCIDVQRRRSGRLIPPRSGPYIWP